jgi:two-component system phosphate regulon sensor histidine kinase PhoR
VFPQYFRADTRSKYVFQVFDNRRVQRCCSPVQPPPDALSSRTWFSDTVDGWYVRVSEIDDTVRKEERRKRVVDIAFIAGALIALFAGLVVLGFAIRRERRANELKSEFISNVSHELKTPLSIISMFGEMLANGRTKGPEQATEYAEIIWRESVRLSRLIDNVLDFAKIERGRGMYEFAEGNVGEVVERAIDLVGRRLAQAEMSIDVHIEPDLPLIQLDSNAVTLAVMNLVDNAIKYASDGKRIEVDLKREGERIVLSVRDFGPGISPEEQDQIFERFYRARAVRLKPIRGSGIGLALVRHIARAHHGDVHVVSIPGKGATFRLWLPI